MGTAVDRETLADVFLKYLQAGHFCGEPEPRMKPPRLTSFVSRL